MERVRVGTAIGSAAGSRGRTRPRQASTRSRSARAMALRSRNHVSAARTGVVCPGRTTNRTASIQPGRSTAPGNSSSKIVTGPGDERPVTPGSFSLPGIVGRIVEREANRVRLDPEYLIIDALRGAEWFQEALEREPPSEEIDALKWDLRTRGRKTRRGLVPRQSTQQDTPADAHTRAPRAR